MKEKPRVGQIVRLNNVGIDAIGGLKTWEMTQQAQRMTITWVGDESLTDDVETYDLRVDQPLINRFMLDNHMIEEVK